MCEDDRLVDDGSVGDVQVLEPVSGADVRVCLLRVVHKDKVSLYLLGIAPQYGTWEVVGFDSEEIRNWHDTKTSFDSSIELMAIGPAESAVRWKVFKRMTDEKTSDEQTDYRLYRVGVGGELTRVFYLGIYQPHGERTVYDGYLTYEQKTLRVLETTTNDLFDLEVDVDLMWGDNLGNLQRKRYTDRYHFDGSEYVRDTP